MMRSSANWLSIMFKVIQLIICIGTLIFKKITDNKARMITIRNQKLSNEWNLLQNVTWSEEGNDFSIFTYAGYIYILAICLLSRLLNLNKREFIADVLFIRFGMIIFLLQGILVFYSAEFVPNEIRLNALILGCLSFFVCALFFLENCLTVKSVKFQHKNIQTDRPFKKMLSSIAIHVKDEDDGIIHTYV